MRLKRITSLLLCGLLTFAGVAETTVAVLAAEQHGTMSDAVTPKQAAQDKDFSSVALPKNSAKTATPKSSGGIAINLTNFPDAMFATFVWYYFDLNNDFRLSQTEINRVTSMNLADLDIESLVGIRYFSALTTLRCDGNLLTSLDVSRNTKLKTLSCDDNKLKTLKVPSSLTRLYAANNQLSSITGLNKCKKMNQLGLANNLFVKLPNLRSFKSLRGMSLEKNYLTSKELKAKLPKHALASNNKKWFNRQVKGQKKLAKPSGLKVATSGKKALKITWKKASDATSYEVWVATSKNGKYKKVKTTTATSFTHRKLTKGRTYFYKVRTCRKIGKNTVRSAYTGVKSRKSK